MDGAERRVVSALATVLALRMFGLFIVLPVMMLHAQVLPGANATLAGAALGVYGLTQALFQLPFGIWSDRYSRKKVIHAGLLFFIAGSITVALADGIYTVIAGRALQGVGAIASVVLALASDLTRDEQRAKTMAVIGVGIGGVFMLSLIAGPVLDGWLGVRGMFWLAAVCGAIAMLILQWCVPESPHQVAKGATPLIPGAPPLIKGTALRKVLTDALLLRLNFGILLLHLVMAALFVALPGTLVGTLALAPVHHWKLYVPVLVASLPVMALLLTWQGRARSDHGVMLLAVMLACLSQLLLYAGAGATGAAGAAWLLPIAAWLFFCGFNTLEAVLPARVSRHVTPHERGAALGVYYSAQFLGVFCGGLGGGWLLGHFGAAAVYLCCAAFLLFYALAVLRGITKNR